MDGKPHIHQKEQDGSCAWCVTDDFPAHIPVQSAELDAIEAFLMPTLKALLTGGLISCVGVEARAGADSLAPQIAGFEKWLKRD
jgi:hypothetical protein